MRLTAPLPIVRSIGALTVMFPASDPTPVVLIATLVPAFNRVVISVLRMVEAAPVATQIPGELLLVLFVVMEVGVLVEETIWML